MALTPEEAEKIKEHLLKQLNKFPEDKRDLIEKQVTSMNAEEVEEFVEKNQLAHLGGNCIFCSIVTGKTPSVKVSEDENNIAILEINPLSKGNTLIVPKDHTEEIESHTKKFAIEIGNKIKEKFGPKEIKIKENEVMGHKMLEIIPLYGNETERHQASQEELENVLNEIKKPKIIKSEEEEINEEIPELIPSLPPRIP